MTKRWPRPDPCPTPRAALAQGRTVVSDGKDSMTNRIALVLGLMILAMFAVDAIFFTGELPVFLGKKITTLIEYLSFWR